MQMSVAISLSTSGSSHWSLSVRLLGRCVVLDRSSVFLQGSMMHIKLYKVNHIEVFTLDNLTGCLEHYHFTNCRSIEQVV